MKKPLVIILAGGIGKSFHPFSINKTLVPIIGKPILQHVIEMVEHGGFQKALIITNSQNETWLSTYQPFNITLETYIQDTPMGMAEALLSVENQIQDNPILVMNAVDIVNPLFMKQLHKLTYDEKPFITGIKTESHITAGYIKEKNGLASEIVEKPNIGAEPSDLINLVFHFFPEPEKFMSCLRTTPTSDHRYETALNSYMKIEEIKVVSYDSYWSKLKYAHNVLDVSNVMLKNEISKQISQTAKISPHAILEGAVFVDDGARIEAYAVVKGPSYIGRDVIIGNHALVRESVIEEKSIVGFGSEVARSYIGPRCKLHHNYIGDSVLESDINPSWGTVTANVRLDAKNVLLKLPSGAHLDTGLKKLGAIIGKGVFLGINCMLMPGVTISPNTTLPPGSILKDSV